MFAKVNKILNDPHTLKLPVRYTGLSTIDKKVIRERYIKNQNGKCIYCNNKLTDKPPSKILKLKIDLSLFPTGFLDHPIHLHHDHNTGLTIGALHSWCNAVLWEYENK